ncbi:putative membrane protein SpoIIM required for sporulation [Flavobacterium sp. 270]|uniref:stage II sporulation protein M n=1 Tax=Flavobacterium sp. 270 TaxID=2512114 RepID=UPI001066600C|nr:stage II sporulation protein M [Flavobacterium sp. 270]TDW52586.1 putative membrane protein SpoIIM required for sporulation [Flavobacterium sp. 270]
MREIAFIKQNKEKWLEFEQAIFGKAKKNPDELANLYIQMMNDLAYAQTYYPKSKTVVYLNHLASQIYQKIYKTKRTEKNRVLDFFLTEVPLLVYEYKRYLIYAFVLFFAAVAIGVISAKNDPDFVRLILGDDYVNMTLENIKKGNPVAVYASGANWGSFIGITENNLKVGATSYFFGIFGGIGTFYILLENSVMLGSFQYFYFEHNVFWKSVRGIWIHGSMEVFGIVIEAMAGFILGASILFPKTFSRMNSFKIGFKNSFKIFLSTFPFTIAAGFLEGFITRYSVDMPNWLSSFIILFTLALISFYYLVYPFIVHKKTTSL